MRSFRALVAGLTGAVLMVSAVGTLPSYADPITDAPPPATKGLTKQKLIEQLTDDPNANEDVRVIVQLAAAPAKQDGSEANVMASHAAIKAEIAKVTKPTYRRDFGYLVNGFSLDMRRGDIAKVRAIKGVADVREALMFRTTMAGAVTQTGANTAWEAPYNLTGEGTIVSIIDTGIDTSHKDMRLTDASRAKLSKGKVDELIAKYDLPGHYGTSKVPYGYNYADADSKFKPQESEHGMHVGGISGANSADTSGVRGVAPETQLLAMKVFSNTARGAWSDDIIAAIQDSVKLDADVINMSLGSPGGFYDVNDAYARAIKGATDAGIVVAVSAGNEGLSADPAGTTNNAYETADSGVLGSPSATPQTLSVASADNAIQSLNQGRYKHAGSPDVHFTFLAQAGPRWDNTEHPVASAGLGTTADVANLDLAGKIALVSRGQISFSDKATNVAARGAIGIIVHNNSADPALIAMGSVEQGGIPSAFINQADGVAMKAAIDEGEVVAALDPETRPLPSPTAGRTSSFTSWGPTPELGFKPEVIAPGGNILSTLNDNKYGYMSGTSMSSPHVAGAVALLKKNLAAKSGLTGAQFNQFVKNSLINTAKPMTDAAHNAPYSPRQQGSGMIQIPAAADNLVTATYKETDASLPNGVVALRSFTGAKTFTVTLTNYGAAAASYTLRPGTVYTGHHSGQVYDVATSATLAADKQSVTVPAKGTATVRFTLTPEGITKNFAEGFITFTNSDTTKPSLNMAYMGYVGDWGGDLRIFDDPLTADGASTYMYVSPRPILSVTGIHYDLKLPSGVFTAPAGNAFEIDDKFGGFNPATVGFSPGTEGAINKIYPRIGLMRGVREMRYEIVDAAGTVVRSPGYDTFVRKLASSYLAAGDDYPFVASAFGSWDGTVYNKKAGAFVKAADGQYTYRVKARMGAQYAWQTLDMPVKVDTVAPTARMVSVANDTGANTVTGVFSATDRGTGVGPQTITAALATRDFSSIKVAEKAEVTKDGENFKVVIPNASSVLDDPNRVLVVLVRDYADNAADPILQPLESSKYLAIGAGGKVSPLITYNAAQAQKLSGNKVPVELFNSADVVRAEVNGTSVDLAKAKTVNLDYTDGTPVPIALKGYDKTNAQVVDAPRAGVVLVDSTVPTITLSDASAAAVKTNAHGDKYVVLPRTDGEDKPFKLTGTVNDNVGGARQVSLLRGDKSVVLDKATGAFTSDLAVADRHQTLTFVAVDTVRNLSQPLTVTVLNADDDPADIGRFNGSITIDGEGGVAAGKASLAVTTNSAFLSGQLWIGEKLPNDVLKLTGTWSNLKSLKIGGKVVDLASDGTWAVDLPLKQGVNAFNITAVDNFDNTIINRKTRVFYDHELPTLNIKTDPPADDDLKIYTNRDAVKLSGDASDNTVGFVLKINGDIVLTNGDYDEFGPEVNRGEFSQTIDVVNDDRIRVELSDLEFNHAIEPIIYRVVVDKVAPVISITGPANGSVVGVAKSAWTVKATDEASGLASLVVLVDGRPYTGGKLTPGAHTLTVVATDKAGNEARASRSTVVVAEPTLDVSKVKTQLTVGDAFKPLDGVTAADWSGKSLTDKVTVTPSGFSPTMAGTFVLTYSVTDDYGSTVTKQVRVHVKAKPGTTPPGPGPVKPGKPDKPGKPGKPGLPHTGN